MNAVPASNSLGPLHCAPPVEGRFLRDEIAAVVMIRGKDWFHDVYAILERHQIPSEWRSQFYQHAQTVEDTMSGT